MNVLGVYIVFEIIKKIATFEVQTFRKIMNLKKIVFSGLCIICLYFIMCFFITLFTKLK